MIGCRHSVMPHKEKAQIPPVFEFVFKHQTSSIKMDIKPKTIKIYRGNEKEPFAEWVSSLAVKERTRIFTKLDRVETGNLGDHKSVGNGVWEFKFHFGPGYRIYYGEIDNTIILLLCGGDKSSQKKDVKKAKAYWKDWLKRREA